MSEITLSSGKIAFIEQGKGRHVRLSQRMSEGDSSIYMNCMMSLLVTIDGQKLVPEAFDDLSANDYLELLSAVSDANFTSAQKT